MIQVALSFILVFLACRPIDLEQGHAMVSLANPPVTGWIKGWSGRWRLAKSYWDIDKDLRLKNEDRKSGIEDLW